MRCRLRHWPVEAGLGDFGNWWPRTKHAMDTLLVLDFDGTLCASQSLDVLQRGAGWISRWERAAAVADFEVVPGALEALACVAEVDVAIVTSRGESLRDMTRSWIARRLPGLSGAALSMRAAIDRRPSATSKVDRINRMRGNRRVVMVDNDRAMARACRLGDRFFLAPSQWGEVSHFLRVNLAKTQSLRDAQKAIR